MAYRSSRARRGARRVSARSSYRSGSRRSPTRRRATTRRSSVQTVRLVIDTARPALMPGPDGNPLAVTASVAKKPRF